MHRDVEGLMDGESYRRRAGELGLELVRLPGQRLKGLSLGAAERLWLLDWGLPRYAPPHLVFGDFDRRWLPRLEDWEWLEARPPAALAERRVLGADGQDRPICLPQTEPAVLALDPGRAFEPIWFNSSIQALACCCLACQEMLVGCEHPDCVPPGRVGMLERRIRRIDPSALRPGAYWADQIARFLNPLDEPATRHYQERQQEFASDFDLAQDPVFHLHRISIDSLGLGNRSELLRRSGIRNLLVLLDRVRQQARTQGRALQLWIELGEDDSRDDCLVLHEAGDPKQVFPWIFPNVTWGLKRPVFLEDLVGDDLEVGRGGGRWLLR